MLNRKLAAALLALLPFALLGCTQSTTPSEPIPSTAAPETTVAESAPEPSETTAAEPASAETEAPVSEEVPSETTQADTVSPTEEETTRPTEKPTEAPKPTEASTPKPTEAPALKPTESVKPTEAATEPTESSASTTISTELPPDEFEEPPAPSVDISAVVAYGRSYASSIGFIVDTTLNASNAGYFPGSTLIFTSTDEAKAYMRSAIDATKANLIAGFGSIDGCACNVEIIDHGNSNYAILVYYG